MNRQELLSLGLLALDETLGLANKRLASPLSGEHWLHGIYWQAHLGRVYSRLEEVVDQLLDNDTFPPVVDLAIRGTLESKPLCVWIPSGHPKVRAIEETWNEGFGPFKPMGLIIPSHLGGPSPLTSEQMGRIGEDWFSLTQ